MLSTSRPDKGRPSEGLRGTVAEKTAATRMNPSARDLSEQEDREMAQQIRKALKEYFPLKSKDQSVELRLTRVFIDRTNDPANSPGFINKTRFEGTSYQVPVKGHFQLLHEGEVLHEGDYSVGPYFPIAPTLNTRLIDGKSYQNKLQVRRKPGVYPYRSERGEAKVDFNTKKGRSFEFIVDGEKTDTPTLDVKFGGSGRQIIERGAYAMMRAFGYSDKQIKKKWGDEVWLQNAYSTDEDGLPQKKLAERDLTKLVDKVYHQLSSKGEEKTWSAGLDTAAKRLRERMDEQGDMFDRKVTKTTLGSPEGKFTPKVVEKASEKLVGIYTNKEEPPHRFSERFRELTSLPTQVNKAITHHSFRDRFVPKIENRLNEIAQGEGKVTDGGKERDARVPDALASINKLRKTIRNSFTTNELSTTTETNNILDIEGRSKEITIKGPGGIQNDHAIQAETVALDGSRLGLMDIVKTQVSAPGVTMPMASGAVMHDGEIKRMVYDRKTKTVRPVDSDEVAEGGLAFPDEFDREEKKGGVIDFKPKEKLYSIEDAEMLPGVQSITKGGRVKMAPGADDVELDGHPFPKGFKRIKKDGETFFTPKKKKVWAVINDQVQEAEEKDVRFVVADPTHLYSDNTNATPFLNHDSGPRLIMGANQMTQALSLTESESPLVDAIDERGETFSKRIGRRYNVTAPFSGTIKSIKEKGEDAHIVIESKKGERKELPLLKDFPLNQGGFIDQQPTVKRGESVAEGQILTKNNYTDEEGELAIGRNLRVAYIPFSGWNYEDGIVISESAAKKLESEHIKEKAVDIEDGDRQGVKAYNALNRPRGKAISRQNIRKLDADGVIREGAKVEMGDVLVPVIRPSSYGDDEEKRTIKRMLGEQAKNRDVSIVWDSPHEGTVTKVVKTPTKIRVYVKTREPFQEGDKITGRHGEKGIVSKIVPDAEMPQTQDGKAIEMAVDPHGVPSRNNSGQLLELAAGKVAEKTGEKYLVRNHDPEALGKVKKDLEKHGLSDKEDLYDPETGKTIKGISTGLAFKAKLKHQLDKKFSARKFFEDGYNMEQQPVTGAAIDNLTLHALIGHNARANLSEMARLKGTQNEDYWTTLAQGQEPKRVAKSPHSFKKMRAMMESLGVSVKKNQNELELVPMTDEEIDRKAGGREISNYNSMEMLKNRVKVHESSVFSKSKFGPSLESFAKIEMGEPMPNPMFSKAIALLLKEGGGTKGDSNVRVQKGKKSYPVSSMAIGDVEKVFVGRSGTKGDRSTGDRMSMKVNGEEKRGGHALKEALKTVDLDKTIAKVEGKLKKELNKDKANGTRLNNLHQTLRYAKSLQKNEIKPEDGYMMSKLPVMPLAFRQPTVRKNGEIMMDSVNHLYRSVVAESDALKKMQEFGFDDDLKEDQRAALFSSVGALMGASGKRPVGNFEGMPIADALASPKIVGGSGQYELGDTDAKGPKGSYPQKYVTKKKMEASGRTTIVPDPNLDVDKVGMPAEMAWRLYEPFVRKNLSRAYDSRKASKMYRERHPTAKEYLKKEMKKRPVMTNRAPSWWQYNVMAFEPELVETDPENPNSEKMLKVPNLVVNNYFGGDFDGDTMSVHVPAEDEAVNEAWEMTPSKHLKAPGSYKMMIVPNMSMLLGMNFMTKIDRNKETVASSNPIKDYQKNEIEIDQPVRYKGRLTTAGWEIIDDATRSATGGKLTIDDILEIVEEKSGRDVSRETFQFNKKTLNDEFLPALIEEFPERYAQIVGNIAREADAAAKVSGFSVGISDLEPFSKEVKQETRRVDQLVPKLAKQIAKERDLKKPGKREMDQARIQLYRSGRPVEVDGKKHESAVSAIERRIKERDPEGNSILTMMSVGSKGNTTQIRQMLAAPLMVDDVQKNTVATPITRSYAEGLSTAEYYTQQHGALAGLRDRSVETSRPGDIGKQIVASSSTLLITEKDCGTTEGVNLPTEVKDRANPDLQDRVLSEPVAGLPRGTVIGGREIAKLRSSKTKTVEVRSPLKCNAANGICQKCYGKNERGVFPKIGENVGIREGQAVVESSTKLTLKSFHTSGAAEDEGEGGFERFEEIVHLKSPSFKAALVRFPNGQKGDRVRVKKIKRRKGLGGETVARLITLEHVQSGEERTVRITPNMRLKPTVREGAIVKNGDPLTNGNIDPNEIREVGGLEAQQEQVTNDLHAMFKDIGGIGRRTAETVVTSMSNLGRITDPGDSDFTLGDQRTVGEVKAFNRVRQEKVRISDAAGRLLGETVKVGGKTYRKGSRLDAGDVQAIRQRKGPSFRVVVKRRPAKMKQEMHSVLSLPQMGQDWLPKMNYREIKKQIRESAIRGDSSPINGRHPISAYMYGKSFDQGETKDRWRY